MRLATTTALFAPPSVGVWYGVLYGNGRVLLFAVFALLAIFAALLIADARTNREVTRRPGYVIGGPQTRNEKAAALHTQPAARPKEM